jgi:hypothetical protein
MVLGAVWEDQNIPSSHSVALNHSRAEEIVTVVTLVTLGLYLVELKSYENNDKSTTNLRPYSFESTSTHKFVRYPVTHEVISHWRVQYSGTQNIVV